MLDPRIRSLKHLTSVERFTAKTLFVEDVYELSLRKAQEEFPDAPIALENSIKINTTKSKFASLFDSPSKANTVTFSPGVDSHALRCRIEREIK